MTGDTSSPTRSRTPSPRRPTAATTRTFWPSGKLQVYEDCARNFRLGESTGLLRPWEHLPNLLAEDEHIDMYIANTASEWIRGYADDRPFYLQVCLMGPHPPFDAPARYRDMFDPEDMPPAIMEPPAEPISPQIKRMFARKGLKDMTESQCRTLKSHYYAKVAYDDHAVGSVLQSLDAKGLLANTWIVYTSDHGEMLGDHRLSPEVSVLRGRAERAADRETTGRNPTLDGARLGGPLRHLLDLARRCRCPSSRSRPGPFHCFQRSRPVPTPPMRSRARTWSSAR